MTQKNRKKYPKDKSTTPEETQPLEHATNPKSREKAAQTVFDYSRYSTDPSKFQTWVDVISNRLRLSSPLTGIAFSIAVFLGGLGIAGTIDFERQYLTAWPIYIGTFGIAWVIGIIRHSSQEIHAACEELRPCFLVSDEQYKTVMDRWFTRMASHTGNLYAALVLALLAWGVVYLAFFQDGFLQELHISSLRPSIFQPSWYIVDSRMWVRAGIIAYYGLFVALPLATGGRALVLNFFFLLSLRRFPVIPLANVIRVRFQKITNLYIFVAMSWFVGVTLFGVVLFDNMDWASTIGLVALGFLGSLTFLTPQILFRNYIVRSHRMVTQWVLPPLYGRFGIELRERSDSPIPLSDVVPISSMDDLAGYVEATSPAQLWVYDPSEFILLFLGQGLALGSVFLEDIVRFLT